MNTEKPREASVRNTLRIFYQTATRHQKEAFLSLFNPFGAVLISVGAPFCAGKVLGNLAHAPSEVDKYLILLGIISVLGIAANRIGTKANMRLQARTMADLHRHLFERLLARGASYHANHISGKLISDAIDFVNAFSTLMQSAFLQGFSFLLVITIGLITVFVNSWQLGLYLLAVVGITLLWVYKNSRKRVKIRARRLVATKNLTAHLSDTIVNAVTVKTFAHEASEMKRNYNLNETLKKMRLRDWQSAIGSGNSRMAALLTMQVLMMVLISRLVARHPQMLATGIFALTYTMTLTNRLFELNTISMQIDEALLNAGPMTRMLMEDAEIVDHPNAQELKVTNGRIDLASIHFAYKESTQDTAVFKDLSLAIKPGEKIGLVGPSGGGKSTLTRLLLRFDDLNKGAIEIDGQDIAKVTQSSLRSNIAYVPQEPLLFHRTVRENIAYGKPDASDDEIRHAAEQAQAHTFIQNLPEGYDTIVGERGVKLSGGQRQRIAIARAILKDAPILVLDEATSALDSESEVAIQKALWELMKGRTAIVVAHRLSTIQKMDRIIVLKDGAIVESGSHQALLKENGLYAQLWAHQSGGFLED